jgi:hypothetical protein
VIVLRDDVERLPAQLRREIDQILLAHALEIDRRGPCRKRLGFAPVRRELSEAGTGRSSIGQTGSPVTRSKT